MPGKWGGARRARPPRSANGKDFLKVNHYKTNTKQSEGGAHPAGCFNKLGLYLQARMTSSHILLQGNITLLFGKHSANMDLLQKEKGLPFTTIFLTNEIFLKKLYKHSTRNVQFNQFTKKTHKLFRSSAPVMMCTL